MEFFSENVRAKNFARSKSGFARAKKILQKFIYLHIYIKIYIRQKIIPILKEKNNTNLKPPDQLYTSGFQREQFGS